MRSIASAQRPFSFHRLASIAIQAVTCLVFLAAGGAKLLALDVMVEMFDAIGAGQAFRIVVGVMEIVGAILLIIPGTLFEGVAVLGCLLVGAVYVELMLLDANVAPAAVLLVLLIMSLRVRQST